MPQLCHAYDLGLIAYKDALHLQQELSKNRVKDIIPDVLLLLQHYPVLTMGRLVKEAEITVSREKLEREGISIIRTDRGGRATYHGPGQLVVYPILDLRKNRHGIRQYIWDLEESVIKALNDFSISGHRSEGFPGVWIGNEKICAIGLHIVRWVSTHGIALNVNVDLEPFNYIIPCGVSNKGVTSVSKLLGKQVRIERVKESILRAFSQVFNFKIKKGGGIEECRRTLENS